MNRIAELFGIHHWLEALETENDMGKRVALLGNAVDTITRGRMHRFLLVRATLNISALDDLLVVSVEHLMLIRDAFERAFDDHPTNSPIPELQKLTRELVLEIEHGGSD